MTVLEEFAETVLEKGSRARKRLREHCERMLRIETPLSSAVSWDFIKSCAMVEECDLLLTKAETVSYARGHLYQRMLTLSVPTNSLTAALANEARRDVVAELINMEELNI